MRAVRIGVAKEIKSDEYRVALTPAGALELVQPRPRGGRRDRAPARAAPSPTTTTSASARASRASTRSGTSADLLLKVKEPIASEYPRLREGLDRSSPTSTSPPTSRSRARSSTRGVDGRRLRDRRDAATARCRCSRRCREVAGRLASQAGAYFLEKPFGGRGLLLGGVPGVAPRAGRDHRRRDRRLQRRDHRARPRRAGDDPRALDRPHAPPRGDPLGPRDAADVLEPPDRRRRSRTPTS